MTHSDAFVARCQAAHVQNRKTWRPPLPWWRCRATLLLELGPAHAPLVCERQPLANVKPPQNDLPKIEDMHRNERLQRARGPTSPLAAQ